MEVNLDPRTILMTALLAVVLGGCGDDGESSDGESGDGDGDGDGDGTGAAHEFCEDLGDTFGMGAAIFGDQGTDWITSASGPPEGIDWTYGYMYASGDPHDDLEGFAWIVNFRLDTAEQAGAQIPTVTFYRMLNIGADYGYTGSEAQIVQQMLQDPAAVSDYLDDFIAVLEVLDARTTPTLLHVEPDSWGFMMWAFDGVDGSNGNPDAASVPVSLSGANHPALLGQSLPDHAGGLGLALLHLRDEVAPEVRMGWHASNFRVGTRPQVVTSFYSSVGSWDVIVTEPPHMVDSGSSAWSDSEPDNVNNLDWLDSVSAGAGLPLLIWQTYVPDAEPYIGAWPADMTNLSALADNGVAGVLWDPNGDGGDCAYACAAADDLRAYLSAYSSAPLPLPNGHVCH